MKGSKKGISTMALIASVAIVMILISTITISGINTANNAKKISFGNEINMIQTAVDSYYIKNNSTFPVGDTINLNIDNVTSSMREQFESENIVSNTIILYAIDYDLINISSLKYGKLNEGTNDMYVLSKNTGKVYYAKGLKIGENTYYTITDDIENLLSYNQGKNTVSDPVILFNASETEWTNENIELQIKIPKVITTVSSVKIIPQNSGESEITLSKDREEEHYNIYSATPEGNYTAIVNYIDNEISKQAKYVVNNVDKEAPNIVVDSVNKVMIPTNGSLGYMKITDKSDNLSGIKLIKYDYGDYSSNLKNHFEISGIEAKDDIIFIKSEIEKITVYAEDNAGNIKGIVIDVDGTQVSY